jgi:hypothetical protein
VNTEFNWWLLFVGLIIGGGLVWVVLADSRRREEDIEARELGPEAAWIGEALAQDGRLADQDLIEAILLLHADYRAAPPPDEVEDEEPAPLELEPRESTLGPSPRVAPPRGLETPGERRSTG